MTGNTSGSSALDNYQKKILSRVRFRNTFFKELGDCLAQRYGNFVIDGAEDRNFFAVMFHDLVANFEFGFSGHVEAECVILLNDSEITGTLSILTTPEKIMIASDRGGFVNFEIDEFVDNVLLIELESRLIEASRGGQ